MDLTDVVKDNRARVMHIVLSRVTRNTNNLLILNTAIKNIWKPRYEVCKLYHGLSD